jgi:hypothetical protein
VYYRIQARYFGRPTIQRKDCFIDGAGDLIRLDGVADVDSVVVVMILMMV